MADPTPGLTAAADRTPEEIERDMERTRESLTEKVAALETQVLGTIQTATNTISETVQTVRDTVTTAPTAVKETVQETVAVVKDTVKEAVASVKDTITSFSLSGCIQNYPAAALGTSFAGGFALGYLLTGGKRSAAPPAPSPAPAAYPAYGAEPRRPGLFDGLFSMLGGELQNLARQAMNTAADALKRSVHDRVPGLVDGAVGTVTNRIADAIDAAPPAAGRGANGAWAEPRYGG